MNHKLLLIGLFVLFLTSCAPKTVFLPINSTFNNTVINQTVYNGSMFYNDSGVTTNLQDETSLVNLNMSGRLVATYDNNVYPHIFGSTYISGESDALYVSGETTFVGDVGFIGGNAILFNGYFTQNYAGAEENNFNRPINAPHICDDEEIGGITRCLNETQLRVNGTCASGSSIRIINPNGSVVCESDSEGTNNYVTGASFSTLDDNTTLTLTRTGLPDLTAWFIDNNTGGGGASFDQSLNTTDKVSFYGLNVTNNTKLLYCMTPSYCRLSGSGNTIMGMQYNQTLAPGFYIYGGMASTGMGSISAGYGAGTFGNVYWINSTGRGSFAGAYSSSGHTVASGNGAFIWGVGDNYNAQSGGTVFGGGNDLFNSGASGGVLMGINNYADNSYAVGIGFQNNVSGTFAPVGIGRGNTVSGTSAVGIGYNVVSDENYCYALGYGVNCDRSSSAVIGRDSSKITITTNLINISKTIISGSLAGSYSNGQAYLCVYNNGTIFAKDSACS